MGAMNDPDALVILTRGKLESLKELQRKLQRRGIRSELRQPGGENCGSG